MLTRSPPPSRSWSRKTSVAVIAPSRLTSTMRRCSSRCSDVNGARSITPALLIRTSTPPSSSLTRCAAATSESRSVTSASMAIAPSPSSSASAWMRPARRASNATREPLAASARAVASPMPDDAPVMTATRPVLGTVLMRTTVPAIPRYWGASRGPLNARADGLLSMIVTAADDISEFLATRRARITPEQAGLPSYGRRRVPGLRREEVASLAGVSADYYRRLERGQVSGASELVLEALAGALQLDEAERAHLLALARAASPVAPKRSRPARTRVRPVVQRLLDQIEAPAVVSSVHGDYLAANALGRALYAPVFDSPEQPANSARFTFLDPAAREFYPDWERLATDLVGTLRSQAGRNPYDRSLQDLIGELSTRSDEFRVRWAAHNVRFHRTGTKRLHHPLVGDLELSYETLTLDADDGLRVALFTAEPGSASQQALDLLASWAAPELTETEPRSEPRET